MSKYEDFECENLVGGWKVCGKQSSDVQLRENPLCPGIDLYVCDDCLETLQEEADHLFKKREDS